MPAIFFNLRKVLVIGLGTLSVCCARGLPVLDGSAPGKRQRIEYQAAYLTGSVYGSGGDMVSVRLQYVY